MKKQSLILISFIFLLITFSHSIEINAAIGKAKVIDGDTIVINGEKINNIRLPLKIRFILRIFKIYFQMTDIKKRTAVLRS